MRVYVYFNLHRKCFSIKALEGGLKGRVVAHRDAVLIHDATFKVSEAGRQRVLREKRKNVHAGVCGTWEDGIYDHVTVERSSLLGQAIAYNPYKYDSFVVRSTEQPIKQSRVVALSVTNQRASIYSLS
jgi:hypothetical protein